MGQQGALLWKGGPVSGHPKAASATVIKDLSFCKQGTGLLASTASQACKGAGKEHS